MTGAELLRYLRSLTEKRQFTFHGSPHKVEMLEPRQALHDGGHPELNQFGVYATDCVQIALLYALIHEDRNKWGWKWDPYTRPGELMVVVPDPFKGGPGYLYVLNRTDFSTDGNGVSRISHKAVTPVEILEIHPTTLEDLQRECGVVMYLPGTV